MIYKNLLNKEITVVFKKHGQVSGYFEKYEGRLLKVVFDENIFYISEDNINYIILSKDVSLHKRDNLKNKKIISQEVRRPKIRGVELPLNEEESLRFFEKSNSDVTSQYSILPADLLDSNAAARYHIPDGKFDVCPVSDEELMIKGSKDDSSEQ